MGFVDATRTCLAKYAVFDGRASRAEFWWFQLFALLVIFVLPVAVYLLVPASSQAAGIAVVVFYVALWLPTLSVTVRRLHDRNRSGWHYLWVFVPFGPIVLLIWCCQRGVDGDNRFGIDPLRAAVR